jgi:hypothetical protein
MRIALPLSTTAAAAAAAATAAAAVLSASSVPSGIAGSHASNGFCPAHYVQLQMRCSKK